MTTVAGLLDRRRRPTPFLATSDTVLDAAHLMSAQRVGGLAITVDFRLVGVFTEQDMMRRVVALRRDPATTALADVMTSSVVTVRPDISLDDCAAIMAARDIRHLPVIGPAGGLVGMVSVRDVLAYQVRDRETTIDHLVDYIQGHPRPEPARASSSPEPQADHQLL